MRIREKSGIKWSRKKLNFIKERYKRIDEMGIGLVPLFCNLERDVCPGLRVTVIYSTPVSVRPEHEVTDRETEETAKMVGDALERRGMRTEFLKLEAGNIEKVKDINADVVFNVCEWTGRDLPLAQKVFGILEGEKMVYTGSEDIGDKWEMKKKLAAAGVRIPEWRIIENRNGKIEIRGLNWPVIVKPVLEHCSIGLSQESVVEDEKKLRAQVIKLIEEFKQPVLVEEFIPGDEFQVTVLERDGEIRVLPPARIDYKKGRKDWPLLSFEARWDEKLPDEEDPSGDIYVPVIDNALWRQIEGECKKAFIGCGLAGYGRADMREKDGKIYMLEMNSNPGLEDHYSYGMALSGWTAGMTFGDLCFWIVTAALARFVKEGDGGDNVR